MRIEDVLKKENLNKHFIEDYSDSIWKVVPDCEDEECEMLILENIENNLNITEFHYLSEIVKMEFKELTKEELDELVEFC